MQFFSVIFQTLDFKITTTNTDKNAIPMTEPNIRLSELAMKDVATGAVLLLIKCSITAIQMLPVFKTA